AERIDFCGVVVLKRLEAPVSSDTHRVSEGCYQPLRDRSTGESRGQFPLSRGATISPTAQLRSSSATHSTACPTAFPVPEAAPGGGDCWPGGTFPAGLVTG